MCNFNSRRVILIAVMTLAGIALSVAGVESLVKPAYAHQCPAPGPSPDNSTITCIFTGFMTGGGKFNGNVNNAPEPNPKIPLLVHGFIVHCDPTQRPNNLEINWKDPQSGVEHQVHPTPLNEAHCEMNPALGKPNPPEANFNTWVGSGTGRLDGKSGASIYAILTDQSQPAGTQTGGPGDWSTLVIYSADGILVLNVTDTLFGGAQQAHMCHGNC